VEIVAPVEPVMLPKATEHEVAEPGDPLDDVGSAYQGINEEAPELAFDPEVLPVAAVDAVPDYLAELEARYGIIGSQQYPETAEAAVVPKTHEPTPVGSNDPYAQFHAVERDLDYYYDESVTSVPQDEPIQVPITLPGESDPAIPDSPESPTPQPEIPEMPTEPEIDPVSPAPEIQPGYTPTPEITDIPPTTLPEIPQAPPATPSAPLGWAAADADTAEDVRYAASGETQTVATDASSIGGPGGTYSPPASLVARAEEMQGAGYFADALNLYVQALRNGEAEVGDVLGRVSALEPHLTGHAHWHQVRGDLYRRIGLSRRAMREYQLALQARSRSS